MKLFKVCQNQYTFRYNQNIGLLASTFIHLSRKTLSFIIHQNFTILKPTAVFVVYILNSDRSVTDQASFL